MATWHFVKHDLRNKLRNPINGEFFTTAATDGPAQALVRESIQNSLDAHIDDRPVRVIIKVAVEKLPGQDGIDDLFDGAWEHFAADGNGLLDPKPRRGDPCPFLVIEDFNTTGLTGNPEEINPSAGRKNHFYNFFRAEGVSSKSGSELGRWGVGKFVFPRSSRASAHFAITTRKDDGHRLMLGAVTLKGHHVESSSDLFTPDALYGEQCEEGGLVLPTDAADQIDRLARLFDVQRGSETGTSIIVPFIEPDDFTFEKLVTAVVESYFVPILHEKLEVHVQHDDREAKLDAESLVPFLEEHDDLATKLLPLVRLAKHAASVPDHDRITLKMPDPAQAAKWSEALIDEETLQKLRQRLSGHGPVPVRVPVTVRSKSGDDAESSFDIHLQAERNIKEHPVFVREGIIVSGVRDRRISEFRSLVIINDPPLAKMLGDSENPAHTEWQKDGSNFKGRYVYGPGLINFVTQGVSKLLTIVNRTIQEPDPSLTVDFFSIEAPDAPEDDAPAPRPKPGNQRPDSKPEVKPRPARITINRGKTGFTITAGNEPPPTPFQLEVRCAYEIRGGNPLKKWNEADFLLGHGGLDPVLTGGITLITARQNRLLLQVTAPDFEAAVDGFDIHRDLYVRADVKKGSGHADSEA